MDTGGQEYPFGNPDDGTVLDTSEIPGDIEETEMEIAGTGGEGSPPEQDSYVGMDGDNMIPLEDTALVDAEMGQDTGIAETEAEAYSGGVFTDEPWAGAADITTADINTGLTGNVSTYPSESAETPGVPGMVSGRYTGVGREGRQSNFANQGQEASNTYNASGIDIAGRGRAGKPESIETAGRYLTERDGKRYARYDAARFEKPKGDSRIIHEGGRAYYELPEKAKAPARLPEMRATLQKDGTLRIEKIYPREKPLPQPPKTAQENHTKEKVERGVQKARKRRTSTGSLSKGSTSFRNSSRENSIEKNPPTKNLSARRRRKGE